MDSSTSGPRCAVRFMSATVVMCVGWYVSCEVMWYVCVVFLRQLRRFYEWNDPTLRGAQTSSSSDNPRRE